MESVAVLMKDGAFALFFRPHPGGFDSSRVPAPGNCHPRQKNANAQGSARCVCVCVCVCVWGGGGGGGRGAGRS